MKSSLQEHLVVFGKSQVTAGAATAADFLILAILVELLGVYYVIAVATAAACGGAINFYMNRKWAFKSNSHLGAQMVRYALVSGGSLGWNTFLVWTITEFAGLQYMLSKVIVVGLIGVFWNYPLQRYWVFAGEQTV